MTIRSGFEENGDIPKPRRIGSGARVDARKLGHVLMIGACSAFAGGLSLGMDSSSDTNRIIGIALLVASMTCLVLRTKMRRPHLQWDDLTPAASVPRSGP